VTDFLLYLPIIPLLIAAFVVLNFWTAIKKMWNLHWVARNLSPQARVDFQNWVYRGDKAYVLLNDGEAKLYRAKAAAVVLTGCPILISSHSSSPLICQPFYIESLPADEIESLVRIFDGLCARGAASLEG